MKAKDKAPEVTPEAAPIAVEDPAAVERERCVGIIEMYSAYIEPEVLKHVIARIRTV